MAWHGSSSSGSKPPGRATAARSRAVPELTLAIPLQGIVHAMGVLDALRERLLRDGVLQRTAPAGNGAPPDPPPDRSPNF